MFLFHRERSLTVLPAMLFPLIANTNALCDTDSWNVIKGDWTFDSTDCSLENTDSGDGNIVWFGSEDGHIPNSNYTHDSFRFSVTMKVDSGSSAGILFRTGESSTTSREGPSYYLDLRPDQSDGDLRLSMLDNGFFTIIDSWTMDISYDTLYTLTVYALNNLYFVYLDDVEVVAGFKITEFNNGSVGLRTYESPATYYSMTYSEDIAISITPNTTIGAVNVSTSSSAVTNSKSWSKNNGADNKWYDL